METSISRSLVCPVLIGRRPLLDALVQLIEQSRSGQGQTVLIVGEAGIGKSRIVEDALKQARASQAEPASPAPLILEGHCFESDRLLPYAPLLDLLRSFLASRSVENIIACLGQDAPELVKLLPELHTFLPDLTPAASLDPEQEKRHLFHALTHFLTSLSSMQPLLLIIEDIHWSDNSSLEFLLYLARHLPSHPILLLLTYRSEEAFPLLTPFLAKLDRERLATELKLTPLTFDEVEEMIRTILALPRVASADFLATIYEMTEGNPFFIEEMLKSLVTAGELIYVDGKWHRASRRDESYTTLPERAHLPRSVQLAVQQRLDHLSAEAKDALSLAAVAGRRFDFALLQQITGRNEGEMILLVKELIAAQLVVEEAEDVFAFRHALTRQAVYNDLLARERRAFHRLIAETLERIYKDTLDAHLGDLAHHFYAAREWGRVMEYARRAGEKAQTLYAPHAALEQYTQALEAARRLEQPPPLNVYRARGQCYEVLGDFAAALDDYMRALEAARSTGDTMSEWQSLFDLGYLWTSRDYEQAGNYLRAALELARTMNDPPMLARTLNRVGNWYINIEEPQEGLRYHLEAQNIFQELADQQGLAETLDLLAIANYNMGGPITGIGYYEQAITLWRALDERKGLTSSLAMMAVRSTNYLNITGVWATASRVECVRDGEEALAIARQLGWRSAEALALIFLGIGLGPRGEYARALTYALAGLDIATEIEHEPWMGFAHLLLGILYLDLLALPAARQHLEQALKLAKEMSYLFLLRIASGFLASVCIAQQDLARAEAVLKPEFNFKAPPRTAAQRLVWYAQAELELARSHLDTALEIIDQIIASAASVEGGGVILYVWHMRARILAALNRTTEAEATLLEAEAVARTHGAQPILWRIYIALGKLSRARDLRTQAAKYFAQARAIIEDLAANLQDSALRESFLHSALAQMPRLPQASPRRTAMQAFGGLTEREREVAALIAQGKSNRVIADELIVGDRTVGTHVENILSKLGFTSRAQIAAWAVEKGLATR
jgi:ATP/maltotriose-dependent transcriptional regulator MalT